MLKCHLLERLIPDLNWVPLLGCDCTLGFFFTTLVSLFVIKNVMSSLFPSHTWGADLKCLHRALARTELGAV